jgi:flagella basal body P-ring formation protein FlgA
MIVRRSILQAGAACLASFISAQSVMADTRLTGAEVAVLITDRLAENYLQGDPAVAAARTFPACEGTVAVDPLFGGWNTVAVRCDVDGGWRFAIRTNLTTTPALVPVAEFTPRRHPKGPISSLADLASSSGATADTKAGVADEIDVVMLTRSLSRGDVIMPDDVVLLPVPARNVSGGFFAAADVIGRRMKTPLSARRPLQTRHLMPSFMIEEESKVLITSQAGGISVDMVGYALENGQFGDWIEVQNASSGKTVMAKVIDEKKVVVIAKNS